MLIGFLFVPIFSFAQQTFEVRDAYTFELVNGLTIQSKAKVKQISNSTYQLEGSGRSESTRLNSSHRMPSRMPSSA